MPDVVVVGAGISGLAAAEFLSDRHQVTILEAAPEAGGNVRTAREDGRILDVGPTGWMDDEPAMGRLIGRLGLASRVVPASDRFGTRWVWAGGNMHKVPMSPPALLVSPLLSVWSKLRLLCEVFVARGPDGVDESVAEFARRRLGAGTLDRLVAPMVAGIFAADPEQLSLRAAFPRMAAIEREHRSLILASIRLRRGGAPRGHLQTLEGGVGGLTEALATRHADRLRCGVPVHAVEQRREGWLVHTPGGSVEADAVVLACPASASARIVRGVDPDAAAALDAIPYAPVAVVVGAWPAGAFARAPDGFGVLVARGEDTGVLGTLYTHCIFPAQAREGEVLLRTLVGGATDPDSAALPDDDLVMRVRAALRRFLGDERAQPHMVRVFRHPRAIPQYRPGHLVRVAAVRTAEKRRPGLFFTGNHLDGVGVKDCVRAAEELAAKCTIGG